MDSLRKLVAMLGALAGVLGVAMATVVLDWITLTPDPTADPATVPDDLRTVAIVGGVICVLAALGLRRAPRLAALGLVAGAAGLYVGLGYTAFTMLPIGFAVIAALLAVVLAVSAAPK